MIKRYKKFEDVKLSDNFISTDFDCKCREKTCDFTLIDSDLIYALDQLVDRFVPQIQILSGYRCSHHNAAVQGKLGSFHLLGKGSDIKSQFASPEEIYYHTKSIPLFNNGGIGVYLNWIHLDVRGYKSRWGKFLD